VSSDCKRLLKEIFQIDPEKRISASMALRHRFVRKFNEDINVTDADLRVSVNNLRNFKVNMNFQKAVLAYCASQQLSQKAEAKLRKLFEIFDVDKDGKLTEQDLIIGYTNLYGNSKDVKKEVKKIMKNINANQAGGIEYNGNLIINK